MQFDNDLQSSSEVKEPQYQINLTTGTPDDDQLQKLRNNSSSDSKRSEDLQSFKSKSSKTFGYLAQKSVEGLKNIVPSLLPGAGVATEMLKKNLIEED